MSSKGIPKPLSKSVLFTLQNELDKFIEVDRPTWKSTVFWTGVLLYSDKIIKNILAYLVKLEKNQ